MNLVERSALLERLEGFLTEAAGGRGRLVLLAGEAGAGKTALLLHFTRTACTGADTLVGACDPLSTPRPLGPLLDMAAGLGEEFARLLARGPEREQIFQATLAALRQRRRAAVVIIEDLHWADEATLDLLLFLGRRMESLPLLLIVSYRYDQLGAAHPLKPVLGHLVTMPVVRRVNIPLLSVGGVRVLAEGSGIDPIQLHRRTGGNPFFVTEILAVPTQALPDTIRDAVLARAATLSPTARELLDIAAVAGFRIEPWLLAELVTDDVAAVEECLDAGVLSSAGPFISFRHELAREAILSSLSSQRQLTLNRRILHCLRTSPASTNREDLARLAHHAEESGDAQSVLEFAPAAARRAARLSAHREAAAQYLRALRFAAGMEASERAELFEEMAYERYLTSDIEGAIEARREALILRRQTGESLKEGEGLRWLSRLSWFVGRRTDALEAGVAAIRVLERQPPGLELAWAYSNQSPLCMLDGDSDGAVHWGERAVRLAERLGGVEVIVHALNNMGTALEHAPGGEGRVLLEKSLELARAHDYEEHVARAYTNLSSVSAHQRQLELAERYLDEGIEYSTERDLDSWRLYMRGWRAVVLAASGRWNEAGDTATEMLSDPQLPLVSRIQPLVVLASLRLRRGDPGAEAVLEEALELAEATGELQRLAPVAAALAEARWLGRDGVGGREPLERALALAIARHDPWTIGELAYWRWKLDGLPSPVVGVPQPYELQMSGRWQEAAAAWSGLGCRYQAALALAESDEEGVLHRAHAELSGMGAAAVATRVSRRLDELGFRPPPAGPRRIGRPDDVGLTRRQRQVLELLAQGMSNAQIAARLFRSTKTIDHHVSAVLAKLEAHNRVEAVRKALESRLLDEPIDGPRWEDG